MSAYDAVVIGAGLGGLSTAVFLSKAGKKVLLLEKHRVPGGYASSFKRGRFEFEISLHELSGLGSEDNRGPLWRLFDEAGISRKVEFIRIPEFYRSVFPDVDVTIPLGRENFENELAGQFPHEAENLRRFSSVMFEFADQALKANRVGMKQVMSDPGSFPVLMENFGKSLSQVLNPIVSDEKARAVLGQIWGYYCLPPSQLSFLIYALGTASYLRFGPAHVKGTSQALSQAFVDSIEENGGDVWLNNGVDRILATGGKVYGVLTEGGDKIDCPVVVSNANPYSTCLDLLGEGEVPDWYLRRLGAGTGGASTFNVYLGLDCDYRDVGLTNHETFVNTGYDLDGHYELMKAGIDVEPAEAAVTAYNAIDPEFSPPGTAVVVMTLIARPEAWLTLGAEEYEAVKERVADRVIGLGERIAPDIRRHIEVVEVATPVTNARYTGNPGGSIIGFNETFSGSGLVRLPSRGPLEGLYFSGAWVNIGGGYEPSLYSGYLASREVLEDSGGRSAVVMEKVRRQVEEQTGHARAVKAEMEKPMRGLLNRLHPERVGLEVSTIIEETPTAKTFRLCPVNDGLPPFRAGQYVNLFVEVDGVATSRPFTISSPPGRPYWDITVRRVQGGGFVSGHLLDRVGVGDVLEVTSPSGSFVYEPLVDTGSLVFLAGGSGITPFASMIREASERRSPVDIHLVYGSREPGDVIFAEELETLARESDSFRLDIVISEPSETWDGPCGFLDKATISSLVGQVDGKTFYICGPQEMYPLCEASLRSLGVPGRLVRKEVYGPPRDVTLEPGWPSASPDDTFGIEELRTGMRTVARAGEPLMNSLERAGIVVPAQCRAGECGACRTRLVSGRVFVPSRIELRRVDRAAGYIHPCMSYPLSDLRIRI